MVEDITMFYNIGPKESFTDSIFKKNSDKVIGHLSSQQCVTSGDVNKKPT